MKIATKKTKELIAIFLSPKKKNLKLAEAKY